MSDKLPWDLSKIANNISKITIKGGGLAGKICSVLMVVAIAIATIAWSVHDLIVSVLSLLLIFIVIMVPVWRLISLADKNPQSALMDGAEYLVHERMMIGTKERPQIRSSEIEVVPSAPVILTQAEKAALNKPESEDLKKLTRGKKEGS